MRERRGADGTFTLSSLGPHPHPSAAASVPVGKLVSDMYPVFLGLIAIIFY